MKDLLHLINTNYIRSRLMFREAWKLWGNKSRVTLYNSTIGACLCDYYCLYRSCLCYIDLPDCNIKQHYLQEDTCRVSAGIWTCSHVCIRGGACRCHVMVFGQRWHHWCVVSRCHLWASTLHSIHSRPMHESLCFVPSLNTPKSVSISWKKEKCQFSLTLLLSWSLCRVWFLVIDKDSQIYYS